MNVADGDSSINDRRVFHLLVGLGFGGFSSRYILASSLADGAAFAALNLWRKEPMFVKKKTWPDELCSE